MERMDHQDLLRGRLHPDFAIQRVAAVPEREQSHARPEDPACIRQLHQKAISTRL